MELASFPVVVYLIMSLLISVYLISYIVKFIRQKPTVKSTLVDLIYCDFLLLSIVQNLTIVPAIVGCHLSERYALDKNYACLVQH